MFSETLEVNLILTIKGKSFPIQGGSIKNFSIHLHNYGFWGKVGFWVSKDKQTDSLFPLFIKSDLMEVSLTLRGYHNLPNPTPEPLLLQGLATEKSFTEASYGEIDGDPILYRRYQIGFADSASVLWKQHFPCELFTDKTMKDVINAQKGEKISISYDFKPLTVKHPILCLGLGGEKNQASFYDFILWYIHSQNGLWNYDSQKNTYKISQKKDTSSTTSFIDKLEVEQLEIFFPETIRHDVNVLNSYTEKAEKKEVTQEQSIAGIRQDILLRTPIVSQFKNRETLEKSRLKPREHQIKIEFCQFPTITFRPGCLVRFEKGIWSQKIFQKGKVYRVYEIFLQGSAQDQGPMSDEGQDFSAYQITMTSTLELKEESHAHLPAFVPPVYPIYVEGKVVSEQGKKEDETYHIYQDKDTSQDLYKVAIPLWNNQKVIVLFTPNFQPGHFFFPAFKDARVLLAFDFQSAHFQRFLDWRPGAKLPQDGQGNHLLLGLQHKGDKKSETSLSHVYESNKPVLNIKRTNVKDTEMIQFKEGSLIIETKETK